MDQHLTIYNTVMVEAAQLLLGPPAVLPAEQKVKKNQLAENLTIECNILISLKKSQSVLPSTFISGFYFVFTDLAHCFP